MYIFRNEQFDLHKFFKLWKFNNPSKVIKAKLGQKRGEIRTCIIPPVIKRSNSITIFFCRLVIQLYTIFLKCDTMARS